MEQKVPPKGLCPRIVAACRLGSKVFQGIAGLMEICLRKTRSYSNQPMLLCLKASLIISLEYASISLANGSDVLTAM
jgi:hypothetical protein